VGEDQHGIGGVLQDDEGVVVLDPQAQTLG
jgi:hypothetical protein